jgi:hypothetical protein
MMKYRNGSTFPDSHDTGKEARRRIIAGLSGLIVMLLLVMLASLLTGQAREEAEVAKAQAEAAGVPNPGSNAALPSVATDPLAATPTDATNSVPAAPVLPDAGTSGVVVPDLQPDPELKTVPRAQ